MAVQKTSAEGAALLCCQSTDVPRPRRYVWNSFDLSRFAGAYAPPALRAWTARFRRRGFAGVFGVLCAAVLLAACARPSPQAVEIEPDDMCRHCKMAISELKYAAEFLSKDGEVSKFDDIGCMIQHLETRKDKGDIAACFVVDFHSREWIDGEQAYFVRSPALKTPMSGNFAAFKHLSGAEEASAAFGGKLLRFDGLPDAMRSGDSPMR